MRRSMASCRLAACRACWPLTWPGSTEDTSILGMNGSQGGVDATGPHMATRGEMHYIISVCARRRYQHDHLGNEGSDLLRPLHCCSKDPNIRPASPHSFPHLEPGAMLKAASCRPRCALMSSRPSTVSRTSLCAAAGTPSSRSTSARSLCTVSDSAGQAFR